MFNVEYLGQSICLKKGETLLDGLLREGLEIPNGCRSGVCQSCVMRSAGSVIPDNAQRGLTAAQRQLGYFLACQCVPEEPIQVEPVALADQSVPGRLVALEALSESVMKLEVEADLKDYRPGQYLTLWVGDQLARSYSLASHPEQDEHLVFHVRMIPGGRFSGWLRDQACIGDRVRLQGPMGQCFYTTERDRPLLLAAVGTGLAPIGGVVRDALAQGHKGAIDLVVGARSKADFYQVEAFEMLARDHANLTLHWVSRDDGGAPVVQANLYDYCREEWPELKGYGIYLCGSGSFVHKMRRQCFLAGATMADIAADAFLPFDGSG